jgi:predicted XRE-type DNA-binding protein
VAKKRKGAIGSSFEEFLREEGTLEETTAAAIKSVLAWQLTDAMTKQGLTKNELAARMRTSRSQLDRVLDPKNDKVQLDTVFKVARALGREVKLELV